MLNNASLGSLMGKTYAGPIMGVEIEVECEKELPKYGNSFNPTTGAPVNIKPPVNWVAVKDGSLRGHAIEYVLEKPKSRSELEKTFLPSIVTHASDFVVNCKSPRVSTHVHLNVTDLTFIQSVNLAVLWWSIENFLVDWCGPSRVGNNFCLRAKDATRLIFNMIKNIKEASRSSKTSSNILPYINHFSVNDCKYSSLNLSRVMELGTFEFRTYPGLNFKDTEEFNEWIKQIEQLYLLAKTFENPVEIWKLLDSTGPDVYAENLLTEYFYKKYKNKDKKERQKFIQDNEMFVASIAYCVPSWVVKPFKKKKQEKVFPVFIDLEI